VLVLEEPLATFGDELDAGLNHVACNLFPTTTILTIAHQMKYVVHCDIIMVVDGGKVHTRVQQKSTYYWQYLTFIS
jgi:ABC-type multidrug transport system fused ATPase/permease subunit